MQGIALRGLVIRHAPALDLPSAAARERLTRDPTCLAHSLPSPAYREGLTYQGD
jgi:hypothetical protein